MKVRKFFDGQQSEFKRRLRRLRHWLESVGLLPVENRHFSRRVDPDERPGQLDEEYEQQKRWAKQRAEHLKGALPSRPSDDDYVPVPHWSIPATPDDTSPSWHNVVRAYEEDR